MKSYLRALSVRFNWLAGHPKQGRDRSDVGKCHRSFPEERHLSFHLIADNGIAVIGHSSSCNGHRKPA